LKCVSHFSFFYEFSAFAALIIMAVSPVISFLKFTNTSPLTPLRLTSSLHYLAVKNNWTRFGVWSSTNYHEESCVSLCDARTPDSWITSPCSTDRAQLERVRFWYKEALPHPIKYMIYIENILLQAKIKSTNMWAICIIFLFRKKTHTQKHANL